MRRLVFVILVSSLLLTLAFVQKGKIPAVKASSSIYQGDLILTGNNVTTIKDRRFDINGSIIIEDNATLILRNAIVNFTQVRDYQFNITFHNPTNGNPRLLAENTTLTSAYSFRVVFYGNSSCRADKLEVWPPLAVGYWWRMYDSSVVSISDSKVYMVAAYADSIFEAFNCTMRYMSVFSQVSANISLSYIESLACFDSSSVNVSNSDIWGLEAKVSAVATASNSTINDLYTYQSSVVRLVNSTYISYSIYNESKVYVCWYLNVHVIDLEGTGVPSANVTATYPDATVAESKLTDANGWTRLTLMEKMMNASDSHPIGNYTVTAKYEHEGETHEGQQSVKMTDNQEITIQLPFIIPEFPSISIISPENKTYDTPDIPLTFTVDETVSWMAYSLDGQANVTITGNTTLPELSDGSHSLIIYAKDTAGNTGASEIVYFTIETQQEEEEDEEVPFWMQWWLWAIIIAGIVALTGAVYFLKKRKPSTPTAPTPSTEGTLQNIHRAYR